MIYLDTHAVVWLYAGLAERFSERARVLLNEHDILISPIVRLELRRLYEAGRITVDETTVTADLAARIGLQICGKPFDAVVTRAALLHWARDPFDRLIVAHASLGDDFLLSKDQNILKHYPHTIW